MVAYDPEGRFDVKPPAVPATMPNVRPVDMDLVCLHVRCNKVLNIKTHTTQPVSRNEVLIGALHVELDASVQAAM